MKKTYIIPALLVHNVQIEEDLLVNSYIKSGTTVSDGNGGWTKEYNNDWANIWDK